MSNYNSNCHHHNPGCRAHHCVRKCIDTFIRQRTYVNNAGLLPQVEIIKKIPPGPMKDMVIDTRSIRGADKVSITYGIYAIVCHLRGLEQWESLLAATTWRSEARQCTTFLYDTWMSLSAQQSPTSCC